jgi:hypothetical protein
MPNNGTTVYSFKDLTGAIASPLAGAFILAGGNIGDGKITVEMTHEWTEQDVAADSAVMVSASAGLNGTVKISCQQTSAVNAYLKTALNLHQTELLNSNSINWAAIALDLQNLATGDQNVCTGVSFGKKPMQPYGAKGEYLEWTLFAANIANQ